MTTSQEIEQLYAQLAEMTRPLCAECDPPYACCKPHFCNFARVWAGNRWNVTLTFPDKPPYPHAPFLGEQATGCQIAPHLRPMCTAWVCKETLERQSAEFLEKYHALRNRLRRIEFAVMLGLPEDTMSQGDLPPEIVV